MGSARVQYELERTLPAIQLAARHGVFDKDVELRAITHRRRQFENALTRHNAIVEDFYAYIDYEERLSLLQNKRIKRLIELEDIPKTDIHTLQNQAKAHIISIYERGVRRLRHNIDLWLRYLRWAKEQKMRSAVSKISARALALFPRSLTLWLAVSDYELNDNSSADTARALLQRAIRINSITHTHASEAVRQQRPQKRTKRAARDADNQPKQSIRPTGDDALDTPRLILRPDERALIHLWIEYIRMELVFLERLRRRRAVLDILDDEVSGKKDENENGAETVHENDDDEPAPTSIAQIAAEEKQNSIGTDEAADTLLMGAIPIASITSAVSLDSTSSLPPQAHFGFLLALATLVNAFPFHGDSRKLKSTLNDAIAEALYKRFGKDATGLLLRKILPIVQSVGSNMDGIRDDSEELAAFKRACRLVVDVEECNETSPIRTESARAINVDDYSIKAVDSLAHFLCTELAQSKDKSDIAVGIGQVVQGVWQELRKLNVHTDRHVSTQIIFVQAISKWAQGAEMGVEFTQFLDAFSDRIRKDAMKRGVQGDFMTYAFLVQESHRATDAVAIGKAVRTAIDKHEAARIDDSRFIVLAAELIESGSQDQRLSLRDADRLWKLVLRSRGSDGNVDVWQAWCNTLGHLTHKEQRVLSALEQHGNISEEVRALLYDELLADERTWEALTRLAKWCASQGSSANALVRRLIDVASNKYHEGDDEGATRTESADIIQSMFEQLLRHSSSVHDAARYLRFLYFDVGKAAEASARFLTLTQTMFKDDAEKRIELEDRWRTVIMTTDE